MDVNPYQALGVSPSATADELAAAYRTVAQIYHPDRYVDAPDGVRLEAERRMKELNEAYDFARAASPAQKMQLRAAQRRSRLPSPPPRASRWAGVPWDQACRERAEQSRRAQEARDAAERSAHNGKAIARPKGLRRYPSTLAGLGEALHTNKIPCRRCRSIQWLPAGWQERLDDTAFFCSVCDRLLLTRSLPA